MKDIFRKCSEALFNSLRENEEASTQLYSEDSQFIRYNGGKVRQNTDVHQNEMSVLLKKGLRHLSATFNLSPQPEEALEQSLSHLKKLREGLAQIPESTQAPEIENHGQSETDFVGRLADHEKIFQEINEAVQGTDFCALYSSGPQIYANQNSKGLNHWFSRQSFFVDFSLYAGDRAVKDLYAGENWDPSIFKTRVQKATQELEVMKRPAVSVPPGSYRVYLAPGAVSEIAGFLQWNAFSQKAFLTGECFFNSIGRKEKAFHSDLNITEDFSLGLSPVFNEFGEVSPTELPLIEKGQIKNFLTSTSTAKEFGLTGNFASQYEKPRSLEIKPGRLAEKDILKELGTGFYLSHLHYVNASDMKLARLTGMTRFGCFWVENGEIVGPIQNLRFDVSLYDAWGPQLLALGQQSEVLPDISTYGARALGGYKLPGMLIDDFSFTL